MALWWKKKCESRVGVVIVEVGGVRRDNYGDNWEEEKEEKE